MSTHLRPVQDDGSVYEIETDSAAAPANAIPAFEGQNVDFTRVRMSAASDLEVDSVNHLDDIVRMYVEGRVVRIDHVVDERTGKLKRVHTLKVVDALPLPWDFDPAFLDIEP